MMKLSEPLRFSWVRKATHPTDTGLFLEGSDFGITLEAPNSLLGAIFQVEPMTRAWSDVEPNLRDKLLKSEQWEPVEQKPEMVILAETFALDWSDSEDEESPGEAQDE